MERWRPVVGFEGDYEVSDLGRVRSLDRQRHGVSKYGTPFTRNLRGMVLSPRRGEQGHKGVALNRQSRWVHALVLEAFDGPRPMGFEGRHKNGDPSDNRLDNLVWASKGDNNRDRKWHNGGLNYKLSPNAVKSIRELLANRVSHSRIALMYGVSKSAITNISIGVTHTDV